MSENRYKETLETLYIYDLRRNFLKQILKKPFKSNKENPNMEKTCVDKVIDVVQLFAQSDVATYCCR